MVGIKKIIVPGEFESSRGAKAIKCSVRAAEGYLYPLRSSVVFIHKPILYIRHAEIKSVEFSRVKILHLSAYNSRPISPKVCSISLVDLLLLHLVLSPFIFGSFTALKRAAVNYSSTHCHFSSLFNPRVSIISSVYWNSRGSKRSR